MVTMPFLGPITTVTYFLACKYILLNPSYSNLSDGSEDQTGDRSLQYIKAAMEKIVMQLALTHYQVKYQNGHLLTRKEIKFGINVVLVTSYKR